MSVAPAFINAAWPCAPVGSMVTLANGYPFDSELFDAEGVPLVRIRDLAADDYATFVPGPVPARYMLVDGDVVVGMDGDFAVKRWRRGPAALNQRLCRLRPLPSADIRFVEYALPMPLDWIHQNQYATTVKHLSSGEVLASRIPSPPLDEQRRIADFLDDQVARIDAASHSRTAQVSRIKELASTQIEGAIDDLGTANGWSPLRRRIRRIEQGWSPQCESAPAGDGEWGVLKVGAVRAGAFHSEQNKRLPDDLEPQTQYEVVAGDLLVSRANTPALVGEAAVVPAGVRAKLILCDKLFRVALEGDMSVEYVATVAGTARSRAYFSALSSGTSGSMVNIRAEDTQGLVAPDASLAEQTRLADFGRRANGEAAGAIAALTRSIVLLSEYKRSLITAAVTGELDVTTARTGVPA